MSNLKPNPARNSMKLDPGGRNKKKTPQNQTELELRKAITTNFIIIFSSSREKERISFYKSKGI
jgi:hypothetical protein